MSLNAMDLCTVCAGSNALFCSQCKGARYCSPTCQRNDWYTHKLLCATFSSFETSTRPSDEHFREILFPADEQKPKVVWVHCPWDLERYQSPDLDPFFGTDVPLGRVPVQTNPVSKRKLSNTFYICHRDAFLIDGSMTNQSVASITARKLGQCYEWRGPIMVYGRVGTNTNPTACKSLDMTDFRHIVDYFQWYKYEPLPASQPTLSETVLGVRINCVGDQEMSNRPLFEAVQVPLTDSVFSKHDTSDIAERIGLPILTRRFPHNSRWVIGESNDIPSDNQDAALLHLCCDPESDFDPDAEVPGTEVLGWGWAPRQWQTDVGSALVVRKDKKPLSPLHVEALCRYCRDIRRLLSHSIGEYYPEEQMTKEAVLAMINRPTFVINWYKLIDEKCDRGEDTDAPFPYDV